MNEFDNPHFALPPVAAGLGPFPHGAYLDTLWKHTATEQDELWIVGDDRGVVPFMVHGQVIRFIGDADLVDYRSPLGEGTADLITSAVSGCPSGMRIVADSLPRAAADVVAKGLESAGLRMSVGDHTVAAVLQLPNDFEEYLSAIGKKERHETRRKRRRYEAALGEVRFVHAPTDGHLFDEFVALHRLSPGDKGSFMSEEMESYFRALLSLDGWGIDALVDEDNRMVAGGFAFQNDGGYFLYNSAYDPVHSEVSPGVVLIAGLIELAIDRGARVFDFLKGDESYKFRLGAEPRQLYVVTAKT